MTRRFLIFDLFLLAVVICATRLATLAHEVLGHALFARIFGAKISGVFLTLFAGGMTTLSVAVPEGAAGVLFYLSGILVNLFTGGLVLVTLLLAGKRIRGPWAFFGAAFCLASVLGGISYFALACFYQAGDLGFSAGSSGAWKYAWVPALACAPVAAFFCVTSYLAPLQRFFPSRGFGHLAVLFMVTLGIVFGGYFLLYKAEGKSLAMAMASSQARQRDQLTILAQKQEALFRRLSAAHPEMSKEEIQRLAEKYKVTVSDSELPRRFPIAWPLVFGLVLGGTFAVFRFHARVPQGAVPKLSKAAVLTAVLAAAGALCFIAARGGKIF